MMCLGKQSHYHIICHELKVNGDILTALSISIFQYFKKFQHMKAKHFVMAFEDPTKAVTHNKHENDRYQKNLHILKLITEAVLFCSE